MDTSSNSGPRGDNDNTLSFNNHNSYW